MPADQIVSNYMRALLNASWQRQSRLLRANGNNLVNDILYFAHPTRAKFAAGHFSLIRTYKVSSLTAQCVDIFLSGWMRPHTDIHRWRKHYAFIRCKH